MKIALVFLIFLPTIVFSQQYYFPPQDFNTWEESPFQCDSTARSALINFLLEKNSKAFIILKEGRILLEEYSNDFGRDSVWYWASAAKTITSTLIGLAANNGDLHIADPTENYLNEWTSCSAEDQSKVTIQNQLTMTTGLDETISFDCTDPVCLECLHEPGSRWYYHNSPYTLLLDVYQSATGQSPNIGLFQHIGAKIGMNGLFIPALLTDNQTFFSRPRDMARFGLLHLANGNWNGEQLFNPAGYFEAAKNTSQDLNKAYGYLWWLNGKDSYHLPASDLTFSGSLIPSAPDDMYMALGKNDQKIYIVPSQDLVVIRMGESANGVNFTLSDFDEQLWEKINQLSCTLSMATIDHSKNHWTIYPNPTSGFVNISGNPFHSWELYNIFGEKMLSGIDATFDVSGLVSGHYVLSVFDAKKNVVSIQKLVNL